MELARPVDAVVARSDVPSKSNYQDYREALRHDFLYSCAYCSTMECEAAAFGFEIDHYYPQEHFPEMVTDYSNLMWSCKPCNGYKSDYFPDDVARDRGSVIIRPDHEDPHEHFEYKGVRIESKTHTGEFNIRLLMLNRQALQRIRDLRHRNFESRDAIACGISQLASMKIDRLKRGQRLDFIKIKDKILQRSKEIEEQWDEILRDYARSPLIDPDPEHAKQLKARRDYLKSQNVILPRHRKTGKKNKRS